jgi:selenocysteine lyase/cysteine desulfurase
MLGIALPGERAGAVGRRLAEANVFVELRGSLMRVSPHLHVSEGDIDRLFAALDRALAE